MARGTGKWGRAIELSTKSMTQELDNRQQTIHSGNTSTVSNVATTNVESNIIDLFAIGASTIKKKKEMQNRSSTRSISMDHRARLYEYGPTSMTAP